MGRQNVRDLVKKDGGLRGYQGFFLMLTLIVMIVVILVAQNLTTAIIIIGLISSFLIISSQLTMMGDRHLATCRGQKAKEEFTMATTAPPGEGAPAFPVVPETEPPAEGYPGAIDFGETTVGDEALALGHVDWGEKARDNVPVGNPFSTNRVASPQAAPPCVDDDAIALYDGDELNTYQVRSRNNPERVWAGIYRRKALLDRYVREELDERENTRWWGAQEV